MGHNGQQKEKHTEQHAGALQVSAFDVSLFYFLPSSVLSLPLNTILHFLILLSLVFPAVLSAVVDSTAGCIFVSDCSFVLGPADLPT